MDTARLTSRLTCNCRLVALDSTTSTNDEVIIQARNLKSQGYSICDFEISPLIVISQTQTAGRGRLGRHWESPTGGLYLSALLKLPAAENGAGSLNGAGGSVGVDGANGANGASHTNSTMSTRSYASLSLLVALAVWDALQGFQTGEVYLKWPNDVLSSTGKLVGILIEVKQTMGIFHDVTNADVGEDPDKGQFAVVGIGVNVNRPETGALITAAYLDDDPGFMAQFEDVGAAVIDRLLSLYADWLAGGCSFESFVADYNAHMVQLGETICVRDALGNEIAAGIAQGIDEQGRLLVLGASGTVAITAGEVTLRNP